MVKKEQFFKILKAVGLDEHYDRYAQYHRQIFIGSIVLVVGLAIGGGIFFYRVKQNQKAQDILCESVNEYERLMRQSMAYKKTDVIQEGWNDLELEFKTAQDQVSNSDVSLYLKLLQADALVQQGRLKDAFGIMKTCLEKMPKDLPIYYLYKTKYALVAIDQKDKKIKENGLEQLKDLSVDVNNKNRDMALYYLGLYYWSEGQSSDALQTWKSLIDEFPVENTAKDKISPWAEKAERKLKQEKV